MTCECTRGDSEGTSKKVMKHWSHGEIQNRHLNKVRRAVVTEEIENAIRDKFVPVPLCIGLGVKRDDQSSWP